MPGQQKQRLRVVCETPQPGNGCNKTFTELPFFAVARPGPAATVGARMAPPLAPDTSPDTALRRIVASCRDDLLKYRAIALASRRPVGIHQTRVALRRLRAAFGTFRDAAPGTIGRRELKALSAEAKWLAAECAPARDLHVFLTETALDAPPVVKTVARRLARSHLERARTALSSARFSMFEAALSAFAEQTPADGGGRRLDDFGRAVLEQRADKVDKRAHKLASLDGKRLHELRIAIKKLRYAATFLQPAFAGTPFDSRAAKAYIDATVRLQGALGTLNDRVVAGQMLADIAVAARPSEDVGRALRKLAKQAASGEKRRRHKLQQAWKTFRKAGRFWHRKETEPT
jgi:CHAD domain-containing protein